MNKKHQIYLNTSSTAIFLLALTGPVLALGSQAMPVLMVLIGLVAYFEIRKSGNSALPRMNNTSSLFIPFFVYICLSSFWSPVEKDALIQVIQFLSLLMPVVVIMQYWHLLETLSAEKMMQIVWQSLLWCLIILVVEMFNDQAFHRWVNQISGIGISGGGEIDKSILNRPVAAMSMLIFALMVPFGRSRRLGLTSLIIIGFILLCFYQNFHSASLAAAIGLVVVLLTNYARQKIHYLLFCVMAAYMVLIVPGLLVNQQNGFIENRLDTVTLEKYNIPQRLVYYQNIALKIIEKPAFGHGLKSSREVIPSITPPEYTGSLSLHPHNFVLQILLETGYLGGILFMISFYGVMKQTAYQDRNVQPWILGGISAGFAVSSLNFGLWQTWWLACFAYGLTIYLLEFQRRMSIPTTNAPPPPMRIMHSIFSKGFRGSEKAVSLLANHQVKTRPVAVMVRADCDEGEGASIVEQLDPRVEIIRVPNFLRFIFFLYHIYAWHPQVIHAHLGRATKMNTWLASDILRVSSMHIYSPHHHKIQDRIICVSDWQMKALPEKLRNRSRLVRNAIPAPTPPPAETLVKLRDEFGIDAATKVYAYIGALSEVKGCREAVQAFIEDNPEASKMLIVGTGPVDKELQEMVAKAGRDNIIFCGHREDVLDIFYIVDVLVVPPQWQEPFMLTLLEGMHAGCWIITTDQYGPRDLMNNQKNGTTVPQKDPAALAKAIQQAPKRPNGGFEYDVSRYDFETHIKAIDLIYLDAQRPSKISEIAPRHNPRPDPSPTYS